MALKVQRVNDKQGYPPYTGGERTESGARRPLFPGGHSRVVPKRELFNGTAR